MLAIVVLCALAPERAPAQADTASVRSLFLQAYAGASNAPADAATYDGAELVAYLLYPYLEAARIRGALARASTGPDPADALAQAFVALHGDEPVTRDLRREWLASLARRALWERYLEQYRDTAADAAQRCHAFEARIALQQVDGLRDAIERQWLAASGSLPDCDAAFTWLRMQGALTPDLLDARARLALTNGNGDLARQLARDLPPERAAPLLQWIALIEDPRSALDKLIAAPSATVEHEALLDGWARLARANPDAATLRYAALAQARGWTSEDASPYALALALALAWSRDPRALDYFDRVAPDDFDERAAEWHVRAALWNGDWERAARAIAAMPESLRSQSRWRYWAARVLEKRGNDDAASTLYSALIPSDNYYAVLAAARTHERFAPHPQPLVRDAPAIAALAAQPGLVRAYELLLCKLYAQAEAEWWDVQHGLDDAAKRQSAILAADWGWYEKSIATAAQQRFFEDYELLYPRPYEHEVKAAAKESGLPAELIYGTLRQESLYRPDAVSSADALGLMQVRLDTARRTARRLGRAAPARDQLFDPAVNVTLGAAELARLVERFEALPIALAAYNAGPNAAARWLPSAPMEPDVWIENIPYNETRTYVQRVMWNSLVFAWIASGKAQDARKWLDKIEQ